MTRLEACIKALEAASHGGDLSLLEAIAIITRILSAEPTVEEYSGILHLREMVAMAILDKLVKIDIPLDMGKDITTLAEAAIAAIYPNGLTYAKRIVDSREEFEKWHESRTALGNPFRKNSKNPNTYHCLMVQSRWEAWQAAFLTAFPQQEKL